MIGRDGTTTGSSTKYGDDVPSTARKINSVDIIIVKITDENIITTINSYTPRIV